MMHTRKTIWGAWLFIGIVLFILTGPVCAATVSQAKQVIVIQKADGTVEQHVSGGKAAVVFALTPQGPSDIKLLPNSGSKAIVKFKTSPLIKFKNAALSMRGNSLSAIQSLHARFQNDILALENNLQKSKGLRTLGAAQVVKKTYWNVFNGAAVEASPETLKKIKQLSYVEAVYPDQEVKAVLNESVPLIGADKVWNELGLTGQGVKVAIVDSGIDYKHVDFGAFTTFPNPKVIGGYDCINNDNDPMDDVGHGTHVAGIVAADGTLKGVAPRASLLAYKVLDAEGNGTWSTVIDGIERAVDPDGNAETADGADIINLSLGGPGEADDPVCQAVDNAIDGGVLVVVSAGNDGWKGYLSILSPGLARKALTVGASDKYDQIGWFSSRGPAGSDLALKPDITAPGVDILSCRMGGGSLAADGTSMAAPHAAGAAALLLQGRPGLSPLETKQILMGNAQNICFDAYTQGSGRLDIYKAVKSNTLVSPASLSLGLDDQSQAVWSRTEKITVKNLGFSPSAYTYSVTLEDPMPEGITVQFPSQIELNTESRSADFDFTLNVNNNLVPDVGQGSHGYEGILILTNGSDTFRLPFAFVKAPVLDMKFDRAPNYIIIHNKTDWSVTILPYKDRYTALLPAKAFYDVIAFFNAPYQIVVKENIPVNNRTTLNISSSEAVHQMTFHLVDHDNQPLKSDIIWMLKTPAGFGVGMFDVLDFPPAFSDVSGSYAFDWTVYDFSRNQAVNHQVAGQMTGGIQAAMDFTNTPAEYAPMEYIYDVDPATKELFVVHRLVHAKTGSVDSTFIGWPDTPPLRRNPDGEFKRTIYVRPIENRNFYYNFTRDEIYKYQGPYFDGDDALVLRSPYYLMEKNQPLRGYLAFDWTNPVFSNADMRIRCGMGPHYWSARMGNTPEEIRLSPGQGNLNSFYLSPLGDFAANTGLSYALYNQDGQLVKSAAFPSAGGKGEGPFEAIKLPAPGYYQFMVPYAHYYVNGKAGSAVTWSVFDTRRSDPNPPFMQNFKILSQGKESNVLSGASANEIVFDILDDQGVASVVLLTKADSDTEWKLVPGVNSGRHFSASISDLGKTDFYSLWIIASDYGGNSLDTSMNSAFYYVARNPKSRISGTVTYNGAPLAGVILKGLPGDPKTDSSGQYNASVDYNWSGIVTPTLEGCAFTPANKTYTNITADQTDQNYIAKSADGVEILTKGQTLPGLSASKGQWLYYKIKVPGGAKNLKVITSGGSGDADLYLKFGSKPTTTNYQYCSTKGANAETCTVRSVASEGYCYIGIYAYKNFSGLSIRADYP